MLFSACFHNQIQLRVQQSLITQKNAGASVNWSNDDKIWVKDNTNNWQQSGQVTFPSTTNKSEGMFALLGAYTKTSHSVVYTNKPISGTNIQVEIKAEQKQSAPNNFDHAGVSGDCGVAIAQKVATVIDLHLAIRLLIFVLFLVRIILT